MNRRHFLTHPLLDHPWFQDNEEIKVISVFQCGASAFVCNDGVWERRSIRVNADGSESLFRDGVEVQNSDTDEWPDLIDG